VRAREKNQPGPRYRPTHQYPIEHSDARSSVVEWEGLKFIFILFYLIRIRIRVTRDRSIWICIRIHVT
jgi:hypothetical protein